MGKGNQRGYWRQWALISVLFISLLGMGPSQAAMKKEALSQLETIQEAFASVAEALKAAVVNISTTQKIRPPLRRWPEFRHPFREFFGEEFFERFFGEIPQREIERKSLGSGVIVDKRGYILTNNHVVEKAKEIEVRLSDRRKFSGRVVGKDPKTDIAVIKIDVNGDLPVARLGDSNKVRIGQWAIAIGNPFGLDHSVTVGVISATGRSDVGIATYEDFIQTDASINPGNSGGPLANIYGEVIGINTAIVAAGQGIGFAIPINMVKDVMDKLISQGRVIRGWLGVGIQELTEDLASKFGVEVEKGVLIGNVIKDTPAERGGIKTGDIIIEYNGTKITNVRQLQRLVASTPPEKEAEIKIIRNKKEIVLTVKIGEMPSEDEVLAEELSLRYGFSVQGLTPELAEKLKVQKAEGVLVSSVEAGGPAAMKGVRSGDVIIEVNHYNVKDLKEFREALKRVNPGDSILLLILREEGYLFVVVPPKEEKR